MSPKANLRYRVLVCGPVPADLAERLAQAHAAAILAQKMQETQPTARPVATATPARAGPEVLKLVPAGTPTDECLKRIGARCKRWGQLEICHLEPAGCGFLIEVGADV